MSFLSRYSIKVYGDSVIEDTNIGGKLIDSGCFVRVYDAGSSTDSTIYKDKAYGTKDNWITRSEFDTAGGIEFYSESTSHTINIADKEGNVGSYLVSPRTRAVKLNQSSPHKVMCIPYTWEDSAVGDEVDSGCDFPPGAYVYNNPFHYNRTADSGISITVGLLSTETNGDADGLIASRGVASSGDDSYEYNLNVTTGSNEVYYNQSLVGALLDDQMWLGTDLATDVGTFGVKGYFVNVGVAKSISYTLTSGADTAEGIVFLPFTQTI